MIPSTNPGHIVRRSNRADILGLLSRQKDMLRSEICSQTGLTAAAVSRISRELIDACLIKESMPVEQKGVVGRRSAYLSINDNGAFVIGITITANRKLVGLFNASRECLNQIDLSQMEESNPEEILAAISNAAMAIIDNTDFDKTRLMGVGVSVAVPSTDFVLTDGTVTSQILGWHEIPVAKILNETLKLPIAVEARASALLRAEAGALNIRSNANLFLINVVVGVGTAGLFQGKILWAGTSGFGRLSHIPHPRSNVQCDCGRKGCLEYSASGASVVQDLDPSPNAPLKSFSEMGPKLTTALGKASEGSLEAKEAFFEAGKRMAMGVDTSMAMLNPDIIILAGETGRQPDFVRGVRRGLRDMQSPVKPDELRISQAKSSEASACIALDAFVFSEAINVEKLIAA